jgi:uroporphyrinogen-III synthase
VLIVRGDTPGSDEPAPQGVGRDWLAQHLAAAGAVVDYVVAYQRGAPQWDQEQLASGRKRCAGWFGMGVQQC